MSTSWIDRTTFKFWMFTSRNGMKHETYYKYFADKESVVYVPVNNTHFKNQFKIFTVWLIRFDGSFQNLFTQNFQGNKFEFASHDQKVNKQVVDMQICMALNCGFRRAMRSFAGRKRTLILNGKMHNETSVAKTSRLCWQSQSLRKFIRISVRSLSCGSHDLFNLDLS